MGSPPLTRGQLKNYFMDTFESRITPAHAGTTGADRGRAFRHQDHPRSRGDNCNDNHSRRKQPGSPPLTRGQPVNAWLHILPHRITPAHAGTTACAQDSAVCVQDHPRSRGDNSQTAGGNIIIRGSPPLTRGQPFVAPRKEGVTGITPAHAGTTRAGQAGRRRPGDHPRSRGDNGARF